MFFRLHPVAVVGSITALVVGLAALGYGAWTRPLVDAEQAMAERQTPIALESYATAERRIGRFEATRRLFATEYAAAVFNQLALLYRAGAYDAVVAAAASAPPDAAPKFWSGTALLARAISEQEPQSRLVWLSRAEEDLEQALRAAPDDWDTRFNYEVAARLLAGLQRQPQKKTDTRMQLLRPQPQPRQPPRRVG
jgi:hypothetical protein